MTPLSLAAVLSSGPRAPRRTVAKRMLLLLLSGLLLVALTATLLPKGNATAQNVGSVHNPKDVYYGKNGQCYVDMVAATGLDGTGAQEFLKAMQVMIGNFGYGASYTFDNGTVTATAQTDCPIHFGPDEGILEPGTGKMIYHNWIRTSVGQVASLGILVAIALGVTSIYKYITDKDIEAGTRLSAAIAGFGGFLPYALRGYVQSDSSWQVALSAGLTSIFTNYLTEAYGFTGLQDILKLWFKATLNFALKLVVCDCLRARKGINDLGRDVETTLGQIRG